MKLVLISSTLALVMAANGDSCSNGCGAGECCGIATPDTSATGNTASGPV